MPKVSHIAFKRGRQERFVIHWDNGEMHLLSPEISIKFGVVPEKDFSDEAYAELLKENELRLAKDQILRYLEIRPHSRKELWMKTVRKGFSSEAINAALDDLEKVNLIDDEQFARQFIDNELKMRPCGRRLLQEKLFNKGVSAEIFNPILEEAFEEHSEEELIEQITRKFLKKQRNVSDDKRNQKLVRHLQGKGFSWELINWVLYETNIVDTIDSQST